MAGEIELAVRFIHIAFGVTWVGSSVFFGHAVVGGLRKAPASARGPARFSINRNLSLSLAVVVGPLTIASGVLNQYLIARELDYTSTLWNQALGAALFITLFMMAVGYAILLPTLRKIQALTKRNPPEWPVGNEPGVSAEMAALEKRGMVWGIVDTVLGVVAVIFMVVAVSARTGVL